MKAKTSILIMTAVLFMVSSVVAKPQPQQRDPKQRAEMMVQRMKTSLSLDDKQVEKITKIYNDAFTKMSSTEQSQRDEIRKNIEKEVNEVLTPAQRETWQKQRAEMMQRGGGNRGGDNGNRFNR